MRVLCLFTVAVPFQVDALAIAPDKRGVVRMSAFLIEISEPFVKSLTVRFARCVGLAQPLFPSHAGHVSGLF
jgi:hypothetical protein